MLRVSRGLAATSDNMNMKGSNHRAQREWPKRQHGATALATNHQANLNFWKFVVSLLQRVSRSSSPRHLDLPKDNTGGEHRRLGHTYNTSAPPSLV